MSVPPHADPFAAAVAPPDSFGRADWQAVDFAPHTLWQSSVINRLPFVRHAFTPLGVNMSCTSGSDAATAPRRRQEVCVALGLDPARLVTGRQVHGTDLACVPDPDGDTAAPGVIPAVDGLVTAAPGVSLLALSADCPLILAVDPDRPALGLAHSGWRGTFAGMARRLIADLQSRFDAVPARLWCVIAPCAGPRAYEIQDDVRERLAAAVRAPDRYLHRAAGRMYLNLPLLLADQLVAAGVAADRIHLPARCTILDEGFYSYRRQGPNAGHAGLIAALANNP